ncbi:hypothetical protein HK101_002060 [Irineochytrium annulatum]|nr:hypothetical protein HK101_002060 [Irineochytrium annulatum]
MDRAKIKSVGFSIVRQTGDFSLELDWIKAVNTPDTVGETDIRDSAELRDVKPEPWFIWDHGDKDKKKNDGE